MNVAQYRDFIIFMTLLYGMPGLIGFIVLMIRKPGRPSKFGPVPQGKSIASAVLTVLNKSLKFHTRASRSEFWWYFLFAITVINTIDGLILVKNQPVGWVVTAITAIPGLAVGTRRLHDIGRSGWWQLLLPTGLGTLLLLALWMLPSPKDDQLSVADLFD